jgi:membrane protease subunit HflC
MRIALIVLAAFSLLLVNSTVYTVDETEQAVILQFGEPIDAVNEPGLHLKMPWPFQIVQKLKNACWNTMPNQPKLLRRIKKNLTVDNFARWRIVDPILFIQSVINENGAIARLDDIIYSELRVELGKHEFTEIISQNREKIMEIVTAESNTKLQAYGMEVIDVRIKRVDLPPENENAVYGRMQAERQRQANRYRSEGEEEATKIMAQTDKEKEILLAEAYREAEETRGRGDAEAVTIYAEAYQRDPAFYAFWRKLEAYRKTLREGTTVVLSPDNEFLDVLDRGR